MASEQQPTCSKIAEEIEDDDSTDCELGNDSHDESEAIGDISDDSDVEVVKVCDKHKTDKMFTIDEDSCLKKGLIKYGWGNWLKILGERNFRFHPYRSGECLQRRAEKLKKEYLKECEDAGE